MKFLLRWLLYFVDEVENQYLLVSLPSLRYEMSYTFRCRTLALHDHDFQTVELLDLKAHPVKKKSKASKASSKKSKKSALSKIKIIQSLDQDDDEDETSNHLNKSYHSLVEDNIE